MSEPIHCDDLIDDPTQPEALRTYLEYNRRPAIEKTLKEAEEPKLFANIRAATTGQSFTGVHDRNGPVMVSFNINAGQRIRVVMASRFGDVGITTELDSPRGYCRRVAVSDLENFSEEP